MTKEPTIRDVLDAMNVFSTNMDVQLGEIKQDIRVLKQDVSVLKQDVSILKQDVAVLKQDVSILKQDVSVLKQDVLGIHATMVTKDYMEGRLAAFAR